MQTTGRIAATLLQLAVAIAGSLAVTAHAADDYPNRPIIFMVPQAVGGSTDALAREIGQRLSDALGQRIIIDNKPGANGIIGTDLVAQAKPDGYTLLVGGTGTMAINQSLYSKLPYDPATAFAPVAMFGYSTSVLVVNPAVTARTIGELIEQARARPGAFKYASAGVGSSPHMTGEMFRSITGINILHIPYKGSTPGVVATVAGETEFMFTGVASAVTQIRGGRLRALSITGPRRSAALPDVPTADESGLPGFEADFWIGLFAPADTPQAVIARLNAEVNRVVDTDAVKEKFFNQGIEPMPVSPERFREILDKDVQRWGAAVKAAGMKGE